MRFDLLHRIATGRRAKRDPEAAVAAWSEEHATTIAQFRAMIARAHAQMPVAPAVLAQIASQARNLLAR
jgi:glutamate dehydrogenase